ncbi:MAG: hypothetical protein IT495_04995 [Gammaproteobacteria bacterium]|nr:hypothetical protein [Gammaproteobacteria bacterium]
MAVTLVVVLIALNFLYKAGKLTSEKMRLQNAADAAAYSVAVIEARDLNFAAYINRAMVANEVAIGQLVGLHSWAFYWASYHYYLSGYIFQFIAPIFPPVTQPLATGITTGTRFFFQIPGDFLAGVFNPLARIGTTVLHNINKVYGYAQQGYHFASILYAISVIDDTVSRTAPGAKVSDFGLLALLGHAATFGAVPSLPGSFVKTFRSTRPASAAPPPDSGEPEDSENQAGMKRFAALTRASTDDFTRERGWELPLEIPPILPVDIHETINFGFDAVVFSVDITITVDFELSFTFGRYGGSELRYRGDTADGQKFGWSAADTTGLSVHFHFSVDAEVEACLLGICGGVSIGGEATLSAGYLDLILRTSLLGEDIEIPIVPHVPFPTAAPFASGSSQIGSAAAGNFLDIGDLNPLTNQFSPRDYGNAHLINTAWSLGVPFIPALTDPPIPCVTPGGPCQVPVVMNTMPKPNHKPNTSYKGLPSYLDTEEQTDPWGFEAPYLILGLVKEIDDVWSATAANPTGNLALTDRPADNEIAAIAKAELYFYRPNDFALFRRADGLVENGSAFSPFWNARLVETTESDRMVAMWLQQKQNFYSLPFNIPTLPDWGDLLDWLP